MCLASGPLGDLLKKTTPKFARPFDIGQRLTEGAEKKFGYGPQAAPTVGASRVARGADPTVQFAATVNKLGI